MADRFLPLKSKTKQQPVGQVSKRGCWTERALTRDEAEFLKTLVGENPSEGFTVYFQPGVKRLRCNFYNGGPHKVTFPTGLDMLDNLAEMGYLDVDAGW